MAPFFSSAPAASNLQQCIVPFAGSLAIHPLAGITTADANASVSRDDEALRLLLDAIDQKWHSDNILSASSSGSHVLSYSTDGTMHVPASSSEQKATRVGFFIDGENKLSPDNGGEIKAMATTNFRNAFPSSFPLKIEALKGGDGCHPRRPKGRSKRNKKTSGYGISTEASLSDSPKGLQAYYMNSGGSQKDRLLHNAFRLKKSTSLSSHNRNATTIDMDDFTTDPSYKGLTDADLEELRGFMDLGFKFSNESSDPRVEATLPALKYFRAIESVQERLVSRQSSPSHRSNSPSARNPFSMHPDQKDEGFDLMTDEPWMVPSFISKPDDMKMHLRVWARAVACTVRQAC